MVEGEKNHSLRSSDLYPNNNSKSDCCLTKRSRARLSANLLVRPPFKIFNKGAAAKNHPWPLVPFSEYKVHNRPRNLCVRPTTNKPHNLIFHGVFYYFPLKLTNKAQI